MTRNEELHKIMNENKLGRRDVARLVGATISANGHCYALCNWLAKPGTAGYRSISITSLMLLKLRVAALTDKERAAFEGPTDKVAIIAANRLRRKCHAPGYVYAADRKFTKNTNEVSRRGAFHAASSCAATDRTSAAMGSEFCTERPSRTGEGGGAR